MKLQMKQIFKPMALVAFILCAAVAYALAGGLSGVSLSGNGTSAAIPIANAFQRPPNTSPPAYGIGLVATLSSGASLSYTVQVTADPLSGALVNWNNHDTMQGLTVSANGNIAFPVTAIRLVVTNYVSGTVNLGAATWP